MPLVPRPVNSVGHPRCDRRSPCQCQAGGRCRSVRPHQPSASRSQRLVPVLWVSVPCISPRISLWRSPRAGRSSIISRSKVAIAPITVNISLPVAVPVDEYRNALELSARAPTGSARLRRALVRGGAAIESSETMQPGSKRCGRPRSTTTSTEIRLDAEILITQIAVPPHHGFHPGQFGEGEP
jgi:hypothetical protein